MLEFLLKYSPIVFTEGQITIKYLPSFLILAGFVVVMLTLLWLIYRKTTLQVNSSFKLTMIALKFVVIALLLFMLLEPIVTVSSIVPRKSSLIVLVDESRSMSITDAAGKRTRADYIKRLLGDDENGLLMELGKNFKIQQFGFSTEVQHLADISQLKDEGDATDLAKALKFAGDIAGEGGVSGIVVLTDGADNSGDDPLEAAAILKNRGLPVYLVGVGDERSQDIELSKVAANHSVIENSVVEVAALIKKSFTDTREVELELREDGTLVKQQTETLYGTATRVSMKFSPQKRGFVHYTLTVKSDDQEEPITQNNMKSFLVDNRSRQAQILYIEGFPRAEFKYIRRAVGSDPSIKVVSLLRTGFPDKFYRQGIDHADELKDGYPRTRDELFKYDAVIFGNIEADFLTKAQLENTADFVSQRGGGFIMLGGVPSFSQGGYSNSPIAKILPVELPNQSGSSQVIPRSFRDRFKLLLTSEGLKSPILQLSTVESENQDLWDSLPELEGYNPVGRAKPGAVVLAVHPLSEPDNPRILLANQRYGRGRSMIFATSSSWHWQMGMSHADMSHERFWRQVLRWLALNSPDPVECELDKETYVPLEEVTLKVDVRDSTYNYIENASVKAIITTPSGKTVEVPFNWSSNGKVEYIGTYHPDEQGLHTVDIIAESESGSFIGRTESVFFVEESRLEYTRAQLQRGLLQRIADVTGGKYYQADEAQALPDEIKVMKSSYSKLAEYDLWDMPVIFLAALTLLAIEWFVRRNKGLS